MNRIRSSEESRAAKNLGYSQLEFLHLTDYGFPEDPRLVPALKRLIQRHRPDLTALRTNMDPSQQSLAMRLRDGLQRG